MKKSALAAIAFVVLAGCGTKSPPERPTAPFGAAYCTTGVAYEYRVTTIHPQGLRVQFQFDWAGAVGDWGDRTASGETASVSHVFDAAGTYPIAARARDSAGLLSDWSAPLAVTAVKIPIGPVRSPVLAAASDSTVRLTWSPPAEGVPSRYRLMFRPVGGAYATALETSDTTCEHDPAGVTGEYRVLAQFGGLDVEPQETLTTIPVQTGNSWVGELNGSDNPGFGWQAPDWAGATYEMSDTAWVDRVDFYVSDFKPGSDGPTYYLASPDLVSTDPGGAVPAGGWRVTSFVELTGEQGRVPPVGDSAWRASARVPGAPVYAACHTANGHFAEIGVTQMRTQQKDVRLETWFQAVPGLRLLRH